MSELMSSKHGLPKLWASVSLQVHICATEYGQLIMTSTCANLSDQHYVSVVGLDRFPALGTSCPFLGHMPSLTSPACKIALKVLLDST